MGSAPKCSGPNASAHAQAMRDISSAMQPGSERAAHARIQHQHPHRQREGRRVGQLQGRALLPSALHLARGALGEAAVQALVLAGPHLWCDGR